MTIDPITGLPSSNVQNPQTGAITYPVPSIPATKLGQINQLNVPAPQQVPVTAYTSPISSVSSSTQASIDAMMAEQQAQQKLQQAQGVSSDVSRLEQQIGGRALDQANQYNVAGGVNEAFKQLQGINAQALALQNEAQAIPIQTQLAAQGTAGTQAGVQSVNRDLLAQNALKALSLGQQAAIAEGNFNVAKNLADQQVAVKYAQIEADLKSKQSQLASLEKYELTPAQEKAKQTLARQYKLQEQELADKKAEEKSIRDLIIEASTVAATSVLANAQKIADGGGSAMQVAVALGVYGKDYLKNEMLKEQLKTEAQQRAKIASDISVNNAQIRNYNASASKTKAETTAITSPDGTITKPLTEGQAKDFTYAQRTSQASPKIEALGSSVIKMNPVAFKAQMLQASSPLTSGNVSPEIRQYNQAVKNFITANLRRESGATINPSEFDDAYQIYVPFPGDDQTTLQAKKQARETAIASFKGNVPGYDARVSAQATNEDKYLDSVAIPAMGVVEQKTTPASLYTSRLLGLPGVK